MFSLHLPNIFNAGDGSLPMLKFPPLSEECIVAVSFPIIAFYITDFCMY